MEEDFEHIGRMVEGGEFQLIGRGSGRAVYDMGDGRVVKAAFNKKGLAQNRAEAEIFLADGSPVLARVFAVSNDFRYLVMEKAERPSGIKAVWKYFGVSGNNEFYRHELLQSLGRRHELIVRDLIRSTSWGMVDSRPVLVDYGFTKTVYKKYYKK